MTKSSLSDTIIALPNNQFVYIGGVRYMKRARYARINSPSPDWDIWALGEHYLRVHFYLGDWSNTFVCYCRDENGVDKWWAASGTTSPITITMAGPFDTAEEAHTICMLEKT